MPTEAANLNPGDLTVTFTVTVTVPAAVISGGADPAPLLTEAPGALVAAVSGHAPDGAAVTIAQSLDGSLAFAVVESP